MKKLIINTFLYILAMSLFAPSMENKTESISKKYSLVKQSISSLLNNESINDTAALKDFDSLDNIRSTNQSTIITYKLEDKDVFANVGSTFAAKHKFIIEENFGPYLINDPKISNQNSDRLIELN